MRKLKSRTAIVVGCIAVAGLAGASPAAAKTYKIKMKCQGNKIPTDFTKPVAGKCSGTPFGSGKQLLYLDHPPKTLYTYTFKGGKVYMEAVVKFTATSASGNWKITRGTGKFKGIKGSGKLFTPKVAADSVFTVTGKVKY